MIYENEHLILKFKMVEIELLEAPYNGNTELRANQQQKSITNYKGSKSECV